MLSTVKKDPDWEDQIEIKYENIPEYIDMKDIMEIKQEPAGCQGFKMKSLNVNDYPSDSEIEQQTNPALVSPSDSDAEQVTNIALASLSDSIESDSGSEPTTGSVPLPDMRTPKPRNRKLGGLARTDFVTDEAWNLYRTNHLKLKTQIKTQKITMSRRKVAMEKLISELKLKHFVKSAEYLQVNKTD